MSIDEVENGINCKCYCPKCNTPLIARNKGKVRTPHFAHITEYNCKGAIESGIHRLAKEIVFETKQIFIPSFSCFIPSAEKKMVVFKCDKQIIFEQVEIERGFKDKDCVIIADVVCIKGNKKLVVEFFKTHVVDDKKTEKIQRLNLPCLEIDISNAQQDKAVLRKQLETGNFKFKWITNPLGEREATRLEQEYRQLKEKLGSKRKSGKRK